MSTRPSPQVPASGDGWTVVIDMPLFGEWLNLNTIHQMHWGRRWSGQRAWRKAAYDALSRKRLPKGLGRVRVQVELRFTDRRVRDVSNFEPTLKPIIDALQPQKVTTSTDKKGRKRTVVELGVGLIPGDDKRYLDRPEAIIGEPLGRKNPVKGQVILHITPLQEEVAA